MNDRPLLMDKGGVSNEQMRAIALVEYGKLMRAEKSMKPALPMSKILKSCANWKAA